MFMWSVGALMYQIRRPQNTHLDSTFRPKYIRQECWDPLGQFESAWTSRMPNIIYWPFCTWLDRDHSFWVLWRFRKSSTDYILRCLGSANDSTVPGYSRSIAHGWTSPDRAGMSRVVL